MKENRRNPTPSGRHHWICKECEVFNHNTRTDCLGCGENRRDVEAFEQEYRIIYEKSYPPKKEVAYSVHE